MSPDTHCLSPLRIVAFARGDLVQSRSILGTRTEHSEGRVAFLPRSLSPRNIFVHREILFVLLVKVCGSIDVVFGQSLDVAKDVCAKQHHVW